MKAIEFTTRLKNNVIEIPDNMKSELRFTDQNDVRVIILISDENNRKDILYRTLARDQFLKGYDDADAIYDNTQ